MWGKQNKAWMHYVNDIIAADVASAVFLSSYMRHSLRNMQYLHSLEVLDIQRYRVVKKAEKVKAALQNRIAIPFVFVVGKN